MQSSLFESSLTDITGKIRLESEDPRWMQLFSSKGIAPIVEGFNVSYYGNRLIEHNLSTGNLVQLLRQTSSRVQQVLGRKVAPPSQVIEQCCTALHLSTIMLHFVIITLSPQAVRSRAQFRFYSLIHSLYFPSSTTVAPKTVAVAGIVARVTGPAFHQAWILQQLYGSRQGNKKSSCRKYDSGAGVSNRQSTGTRLAA